MLRARLAVRANEQKEDDQAMDMMKDKNKRGMKGVDHYKKFADLKAEFQNFWTKNLRSVRN